VLALQAESAAENCHGARNFFCEVRGYAPDGKGFFTGEVSPTEARQLYVDLSGTTTLLWRQPGSSMIWSVPSPDGRNLAMLMYTTEASGWV
jgi:hypothetical protein